MKPQDLLTARGQVHLVLTGPDGAVKDERHLKNMVVTAGLAFIANRMVETVANLMSHMALGSGTVAPALANAALGAELGRAPIATASSLGPVATYTATFNPGVATGAVTEAGIFNSDTVGTMLNRVTFPVVNKGAGDTLAVSWTVTLS